MQRIHLIGGVIASIALVTGAGIALQDHESGQPPMDEAMMEAWKDYATPGAGQERLATRTGYWEVEAKQWMMPGMEPQVSEGRAQFRMELGGRFLIQVYESDFQGEPFRGIGMTAFNNKTKQMQFSWIDNMSTGMMQGNGMMQGDVLHWTAMVTDPVNGAESMRGTETFGDPNRFTAMMYSIGPDGSEFKALELNYVRSGRGVHTGHGHDHDHSHEDGDHDHDHGHAHGDDDHE